MTHSWSVVIENPDFAAVASLPFEVNPPLVVDMDAVLFFVVAFQRLQPVGGWNAQALKGWALLNIRSLRRAMS
jgi:hypothetical protein